MIIAGRFIQEQFRENENGRWIRGEIMPYGSCVLLLDTIGPNGQRKLPFTIVATRPLPKSPAIMIGSLSEYILPSSGLPWYTLEISEYYVKDDPVLKPFGTFRELSEKIAKQDPEIIAALGDRKARVKEALVKIVGSGNTFADRMIEQFGVSAYDKLKENPWQMIHSIPYFTLKQADAAAEKLGIPLTDENRFREHFRARLNLFFEDRRDTYMSSSDFYALYLMDFSNEYTKEEFWEKTLKCEDPLVYETDLGIHPAEFYYNERATLNLIRRTGRLRIPDLPELAAAEEQVKKSLAYEMTPEQEHGFRRAFRSPIHFITGGPGTGKTTLLSAILKKLEILTGRNLNDPDSPVLLVAPTGQAAYRMWEQTHIPAHTINAAFHILPDLGCPDMDQSAEALNHVQYLVIDESSMLDTNLFGQVARIIARMDHVPFMLLVGDPDQLAPVGHGQVFKDLLEYALNKYPECVTHLTVLKRQKDGSSIPELAGYLSNGKFPELNWFQDRQDITFLTVQPNELTKVLEQGILAPKKGNLDDVRILTPFRSGTMNDTVAAINNLAQPYYNPDPEGKTITITGLDKQSKTFELGSRVISKKNRSERVVNGSVGFVTAMDTEDTDLFKWSLTVQFDSGEEKTYSYKELKELDLAYATTIHASQGSEYENVVLCMTRGGGGPGFLNRNLLYTAVTRAVSRLILLGNRNIFAAAAAEPAPARKTALSEWLKRERKE